MAILRQLTQRCRFSQLCVTSFRMPRSLSVLACCFLAFCSAICQTETPLPTVVSFDCPKYPQKAESMRLQGMVGMEITTDGHQVTNIKLLPSHPVLAEEATKNVRTWKFDDHQPTTFRVTYYYVNQGNFKTDPVTKCSAKLELPRKVTVSTSF